MANSCEMKFQDIIFDCFALTSIIAIADAKKCDNFPSENYVMFETILLNVHMYVIPQILFTLYLPTKKCAKPLKKPFK